MISLFSISEKKRIPQYKRIIEKPVYKKVIVSRPKCKCKQCYQAYQPTYIQPYTEPPYRPVMYAQPTAQPSAPLQLQIQPVVNRHTYDTVEVEREKKHKDKSFFKSMFG